MDDADKCEALGSEYKVTLLIVGGRRRKVHELKRVEYTHPREGAYP